MIIIDQNRLQSELRSAYKTHAKRHCCFYALVRARISCDLPGLDIYGTRWRIFTNVIKSLHLASLVSRGCRQPGRFSFVTGSDRPPTDAEALRCRLCRPVCSDAWLYSNVVPSGLSRCKTRNATRQIGPRPLPSDRRGLACTELRDSMWSRK